jgi:hypothetical protein
MGMDVGSFIEQGILVHDTNDGAFLGLDYSIKCSNVNVGTLMIISSSDISSSSSFKDATNVCTCNTTISASVHEL